MLRMGSVQIMINSYPTVSRGRAMLMVYDPDLGSRI